MAITQVVTGRNVEAEYSNVKDTFPASAAPTAGTISTGYRLDQIIGVATVFLTDVEKGDYIWFTTTDELVEVKGVQDIGVATVFLTDVEKGDYIWFTTTDELVEVKGVQDDLILSLEREVAGALAGVAFKIVKKNGYKTISWLVDSVAAAEINSISYEAGVSKSYGNSKPNGEGGGNRLAPVLVDSAINGNVVNISAE